MNIKTIESIIEGVLFAAGDSVSVERLSDIVDVDTKTLKSIINNLADRYDYEKSGLMIIELENSYQMCTRPDYKEYISRLAEPKKGHNLSNAALEVLSVIAYKHPVTKTVIEQIRGVSSDTIVNRLVERGLVKEAGRLDAPGRPMLFKTTEEFLRCFNLKSLKDLPDYEKIRNSGETVPEDKVLKITEEGLDIEGMISDGE